MKCINCAETAEFVFQAPGVSDQPYCRGHLPAPYRGSQFVRPAEAEAVTLPLDTEEAPEVTRTPATVRKARKAPTAR